MSSLWLKHPGYYKGHRLHCPPGVQEAAIELLLENHPPRSSVVDLASGSGAMLVRLAEHGFDDLHCVVRDPGVFGEEDNAQAHDTSFTNLDLNTDFAKHYSRRFEVAVATEVIEHLDSPRHFLAQVHQLVEKDGLLLLTTPNVANWVGRIRFLLLGDLRWFDARMVAQCRHISPVPDALMRHMLTEAGFELVATTTAGSFSGPLRKLVTAPLALLFVALFGRRVLGDCNLYLARRLERGGRAAR